MRISDWSSDVCSSDLMAIDLGTVNTVIYVRDRGIVLNEPSVIAIETRDGIRKVKVVGNEAKLMMGKTPAGIQAIRPLRSAERRVGNEGVSTDRSRWSPDHIKKNRTLKN